MFVSLLRSTSLSVGCRGHGSPPGVDGPAVTAAWAAQRPGSIGGDLSLKPEPLLSAYCPGGGAGNPGAQMCQLKEEALT